MSIRPATEWNVNCCRIVPLVMMSTDEPFEGDSTKFGARRPAGGARRRVMVAGQALLRTDSLVSGNRRSTPSVRGRAGLRETTAPDEGKKSHIGSEGVPFG